MNEFDCDICAETKDIACKFTCAFCKFESCIDCFSTFVLEGEKVASCMSCKKEYNYYFLEKLFNSVHTDFMKKYKDFLKELYYNREVALEGVNLDKEEFQRRLKMNKENKVY
jgi:hypothetical protein